MKIFAISDLHLSGMVDKPMDIFGCGWVDYFDKIKIDWQSKVSDKDVVLIAGDISWGMSLEEGLFDINSLKELKGKKVFIRGNHDYWWKGISKIRDNAPDNTFFFLQNDYVKFEDVIITGSRGWTCPTMQDYSKQDEKIYLRELERFRLSFSKIKKMREDGDKVIVMIHYPPFNAKKENSQFTDIFEENDVSKVVYGHLHGDNNYPIKTIKSNVEYYLTSCDKLGFKLIQIQ